MAAGYEESGTESNKQKRVLDAFRSSDDTTRDRLLTELMITLRSAGLVDDPQSPPTSQLRSALARAGRSLDEGAFVDQLTESASFMSIRARIEQDQERPRPRGGVFISHATSDREIARALIALLNTISGIRERIFCSSVEGYEIAPGHSWLDNIRAQIAQSVLTIFIVTPQFLGRQFCQFELGAIWAHSDEDGRFPLIFPPLDHGEAGPILGSWQSPELSERSLELLVDRASQRLGAAAPAATLVGPAVRAALDAIARLSLQGGGRDPETAKRPGPYACTIKTTQRTIRQVDVSYPVVAFSGGPRSDGMARLFDAEIAAGVNSFVAQWADTPFTEWNDDTPHHPFISIDAEISYVSTNLLSAVLTTVAFTGGANAMQTVATLNLDPHSGGHLGLGDLVGLAGSDLDRFADNLTQELQAQADRGFAHLHRRSTHIRRPYRDSGGIGFAFDKYEIAPGAAGTQLIAVSDERLLAIARKVNVTLNLLR